MRLGLGLGVAGVLLLVALAACAGPQPAASAGVAVVAGENFWGSLATQLGGSKVSVLSVVTDPNADPHEYETSTADARAFADARLVILNGAGYDTWGQKLLDANPSTGRHVLTVADLLGKKNGDNPHFWYSPEYIKQVADRITAEYGAIDAADAAYFDQLHAQLTAALKPVDDEIAAIKAKYAGTPIGSTESIFVYVAAALGLKLTTPPEFMNAVADGNDPPASAVVEFQDQIAHNEIKVLVYNTQTVTAVTTNIRSLAWSHHIPTVGVSETIHPVNLNFQDWQLKQLQALEGALKSAG